MMEPKREFAQLERERREHEDEKAHMRDDYEKLRGRMLGRLRQEVSLLEDGLHALRKQPPKIHVMEDHAERVIDGLKREIEWLNDLWIDPDAPVIQDEADALKYA